MGDAARLVKAMRRAGAPRENDMVDFVLGEVTSESPLKIKLDKIELTETFLILSPLCKETKIKIPTPDANQHFHVIPAHTTGSATVGSYGSHTHKIEAINTEQSLPEILLWRGLKVGDIVYMLRCSHGQKYYVFQRKEGII